MERTLTRARRSTSSSTSSIQPVLGFTSRRRLTPDQIQILQDVYEVNSHPSKEERAFLARELNLYVALDRVEPVTATEEPTLSHYAILSTQPN